MSLLNEPVGYEERQEDDWTPEKGLIRGARKGALAAAMISLALAPLAMFLPYFILPWMMRSALAFGIARMLFAVVRNSAGMVGGRVTALVLGLTLAVLLSQHAIFALWGVPESAGLLESWWLFPAVLVEQVVPPRAGSMSGWRWFHPYAVFAVNVIAFPLGAGFCALMHGRD